ncbi:MAG: hypothetical protein JWM27_4713 [Gemmatimonadetes bacterium]|nr:hypothetical protein [Gemmatimonadota bacterium]
MPTHDTTPGIPVGMPAPDAMLRALTWTLARVREHWIPGGETTADMAAYVDARTAERMISKAVECAAAAPAGGTDERLAKALELLERAHDAQELSPDPTWVRDYMVLLRTHAMVTGEDLDTGFLPAEVHGV